MNTYETLNTANHKHRKEKNFLVSKIFTVSLLPFNYHLLNAAVHILKRNPLT